MIYLPKRNVFFFLFIFSFIVLIVSAKSVSAAESIITPYPTAAVSSVKKNPQDVFTATFEEIIQEKKEMRRKATETNQYQLSSLTTTERHAQDTTFAISEMIACLDEELCDKPTALGTLTGLIAALYTNPPASGIYYARDLFHNAGLAKPAFAQGIGFAGLTPILSIWKVTRNVAYAVLIIIIVAIGFMIIFRMKIDPKTVISFQAALPKIILTLILITLSYPIVGFLIDLMYLSMAIVVNMLANGMGGSFASQTTQLQAQLMTADIGVLAGWVFGNLSQLGGVFKEIGLGIETSAGITALIAKMWHFGGFKTVLGWLSLALPGVLVLIVLLGLLFTFIRLFLLLMNSYIQILISLILGPILLLAEAIPGKSAFVDWLGNLIANLIAFPTTVAILLFASYLSTLKTGEQIWVPPFIGAGGPNIFSSFLGLGVVFLSPGLVASVKKLFKPQPIIPLTPGTMLAPLTGSIQTGLSAASQLYYTKGMVDMFRGGQQERH